MKMIDMFCGGGGMGLGFKQAGWEIVQSFDIDKYAVQMYAHNVESHVTQSDITQLKGSDLLDADLWTFGFPCQDLSVAGKGAGLFEGKRSGLFFEVMRLLSEVKEKPKYLLAENVSGLKPYLPVLKEEFNKAGYVMSYRFYNSKYWGVPQSRPRYFVMGIRRDVFVKGVQYYPVEQQDSIPKLSSILETDVDEKYYISDEKAKSVIEAAIIKLEAKSSLYKILDGAIIDNKQVDKGRVYTETCPTLLSNDWKEPKLVIEPSVFSETAATVVSLGNVKPQIEVIGRLDMKATDIVRRVYDPEGLSPALTTCGGGHRQPKILEQFRVRKLTPREFARLQGFPEDYEIVVSNSQAYKVFGNAVTVNVAKAIAEVLLHATVSGR